MFAFDRSAFAVLVPLALLIAVVSWSNRGGSPAVPRAEQGVESNDTRANQSTVASLPSR